MIEAAIKKQICQNIMNTTDAPLPRGLEEEDIVGINGGGTTKM